MRHTRFGSKNMAALFVAIMLLLGAAGCSSSFRSEREGSINFIEPESTGVQTFDYTGEKSFIPDCSAEQANTSGNFFNSIGTCYPDDYDNPSFIIVQQGDWYYYSYSAPSSAEYEDSVICKVPVNGDAESVVEIFRPKTEMADYLTYLELDLTNKKDVYEGLLSIRYLQVVGNWVYWSNGCGIWRVRTDGEQFQLVTQISSGDYLGGYAFWVDGDWIYHVDNTATGQQDSQTFTYQHKLMRTKTDGSNAEVLFDTERTDDDYIEIEFILSDGSIYFFDFSKFNMNVAYKTGWFLWNDGAVTELSLAADETSFGTLNSRGAVYKNYVMESNNTIYYYQYCIGEKSGNVYPLNTLYLYQCSSDLSSYALISKINYPFGVYQYYDANATYINDGFLYTYVTYSSARASFCRFTIETGDIVISDADKDAYRLNNDVVNGSRLTTPDDGYFYYLTTEGTLCRMLPNGTGWEEMTWLLGASSQK